MAMKEKLGNYFNTLVIQADIAITVGALMGVFNQSLVHGFSGFVFAVALDCLANVDNFKHPDPKTPTPQ